MVSLVVGGNIQAEEISVPYPFSAGATIKSSEMNANFDTVYDQVNKIGTVVSVDSAGGKVHVGTEVEMFEGSVNTKLGILQITSSGTESAHLSIVNPTVTGDRWAGHSTFMKHDDRSLRIFSYPGNVDANSQPIVFYRKGVGEGEVMRIHSNGNVGIKQNNPSHHLHMASGAHVTTGGVWTNASSREYRNGK